MAYRYQKELDLLEATRGELNITDAQYNELTDAIKAQGGSGEVAINIDIPGYESAILSMDYSTDNVVMKFYIAAKEPGYHTFEAGLPVKIDMSSFPLSLIGSGFQMQYAYTTTGLGSPNVCTSIVWSDNGRIVTGVTTTNQATGGEFGTYLGFHVVLNNGIAWTDELAEQFKKNFKIKIG